MRATEAGRHVNANPAFNELSADDRLRLRSWQSGAKRIGVDAVEELTSRPWPTSVSGIVIGIFRAGSDTARWLVVGRDCQWVVAFCEEREVSRTLPSLAEALELIYPGTALENVIATGDASRP
jgi:hypothetical protein